MRKSLTIALVAASALLAACSDSDNGNNRATGPAALDAGDINVDLTRDVRDNLASHFSVTAAKLPNRAADLRYDFHETSRTMAGNEGIVTGDFIFFAEGDPVEKGSLAIFYTAGQTAWFRSGLFEVSDQVAQDVHAGPRVRSAYDGDSLGELLDQGLLFLAEARGANHRGDRLCQQLVQQRRGPVGMAVVDDHVRAVYALGALPVGLRVEQAQHCAPHAAVAVDVDGCHGSVGQV